MLKLAVAKKFWHKYDYVQTFFQQKFWHTDEYVQKKFQQKLEKVEQKKKKN